MAGEKVLGALLTEMDVMVNGLDAHAAELGHLDSRKAAVQTLRVEIVEVNQEQEMAKALTQELTADLRAKMKAARKELRLLRKGVQAMYGDDVQMLEEFGIKVKS